jgi:diguanylate cyclase (GGDEF)-like protein
MSEPVPIPQRALAALLAGMATLLLLAICAGWYLQLSADRADDSRHASSQRLLIIERTLGSLKAAETAQRGFLITENTRYLQPYQEASVQASELLKELQRMYAGDPVASELLVRLSRWQRLKLEELEDLVGAQQSVGRALPEALTQADNGRRYMVEIGKVIHELDQMEVKGNAVLKELTARRRHATFIAAAALFVLAVGACVIVYRLLRREARTREKLHVQMAHDAFHDALTLLPNRRYLLDELSRSLTRAKRKQSQVGLLFIDLDGFKRVNDLHGHEAGDELLKRASAQFVQTVRGSDFLARLGGDEFAVVIEADDSDCAVTLARRLIEAIRQPLLDGRRDCLVSASIGVAIYPHDGADTSTLLAQADRAMYDAKRLGKARVALAANRCDVSDVVVAPEVPA